VEAFIDQTKSEKRRHMTRVLKSSELLDRYPGRTFSRHHLLFSSCFFSAKFGPRELASAPGLDEILSASARPPCDAEWHGPLSFLVHLSFPPDLQYMMTCFAATPETLMSLDTIVSSVRAQLHAEEKPPVSDLSNWLITSSGLQGRPRSPTVLERIFSWAKDSL
jgi:hypothetical protein